MKARKYGKTSLDLMIVLDCTGSMGSWIKACKEEIKMIINSIQSSFYGIKVRISIIGYRDHCDKNRIEKIDFTEDVGEVHKFLGRLLASGGGDTPEDICGGF